jgi:hypothetical protein
MGCLFNTHGGNAKCIQNFGRETSRREDFWKTQSQMGGCYKMNIRKMWCEGLGWISLAQEGPIVGFCKH